MGKKIKEIERMKISTLITAAGSGNRMESLISKQFLKINGITIIERTLNKFQNIDIIDEIIIIVKNDELDFYNNLIKNYSKKIKIVVGGDTREKSTYNGLLATDLDTEIVICHDGVRPFVTKEIIIKALEYINEYNAVIVGVPVKDTIKNISKDGLVAFTPNRKDLYHAQTPQIFKKDILLKAYEKSFNENIQVTDDSSLMEIVGEKVKIVEGSYSNIKITTKEDLVLGEIFAKMEDKVENRDRI